MIALWIAAALQPDWSEFRRERDLTPKEVEDLRARLDAWGDALGVEAFRGFGRAVVVGAARELPVYRLRATTLDERRELAKERRPYEGGGTLTRASKDVDLQKPPLPPFSGYDGRQWRVPVEGSAQTLPCAGCGADGRVSCARCQGRRETDCDRCRRSGKVDCATCSGSSKIRCSSCFGWGSSGIGSKRRSCSWCSGSGKRSCGACSSGKIRCDPCRGSGKVECGACRGKGDQECVTCRGRKTLVDTLEIVISLRPRVRDGVVTELPDRWASLVDAAEPWAVAEAEEIEARVAAIPDPVLAASARKAVEESKAAVAGRARGTQLRVRRTPCVLARLMSEELGLDFQVARIGDALSFDLSPAAVWAAREAERAEGLYGTDREAASRVAAAALRADPDCWRARRLINAIENVESEKRQRLEHDRRMSSVKELLLTCLFVLAGLIAVLMVLLKLYLRRRKLDPRGPQAL
ncbi:MAG TPA: hypothetical protein VF950_10505 [Planctomycetota bacterium]